MDLSERLSEEELAKLSAEGTKAGRLQRAGLEVLFEHDDDNAIPTSGRFVFYELEGRGIVPKVYLKPDGSPRPRTPAQDVADALYYVREVGIIPWDWLVDETRDLTSWAYSESVYQYVLGQLVYARIDLWQGEPPPLILCESRSLAGVLRDITGNYLCSIAATNGQVGGFLHTDVGPLIKAETSDGKTQRVFYLGDLDFSGTQIEANTRKVLSEYGNLEWERIAITEKQARERDLTAIRKPDRRFKPVEYYDAIETEALRQTEIQRILTERLDAELPEPLPMVLKREEEQRVLVRQSLALDEGGLEDADEETDEDTDEGSVPERVIDHLEDATQDEIARLLGRLPVTLSPPQRAHLTKEITRRLARRLRQWA